MFQLSANLLQLRVHVSRSNYIAPLLLFDDVKAYFCHNTPEPSSDFNMLYWGLYNYYITYTRENSFATRYILNDWPESSKLSGIAMLEKLTNSESVFVKTEALYFLTRIYLEGEKDFAKAETYNAELVRLYPKNLIYKWFYLRTLLAKNAIEKFETLQKQYLQELSNTDAYTLQQKQHFKALFSTLKN